MVVCGDLELLRRCRAYIAKLFLSLFAVTISLLIDQTMTFGTWFADMFADSIARALNARPTIISEMLLYRSVLGHGIALAGIFSVLEMRFALARALFNFDIEATLETKCWMNRQRRHCGLLRVPCARGFPFPRAVL